MDNNVQKGSAFGIGKLLVKPYWTVSESLEATTYLLSNPKLAWEEVHNHENVMDKKLGAKWSTQEFFNETKYLFLRNYGGC